jgi:hypothetical protein
LLALLALLALSERVADAEVVVPVDAPEPAAGAEEPGVQDSSAAVAPAFVAGWGAFELLGASVEPGATARLSLPVTESVLGDELPLPVIVHRGVDTGPTLCLTAGVHGDEVNGVEVVRRVVEQVDATRMRGTLVSVPIVNLNAVRRGSRYLPDRRDLNRYFPGRPHGSAAARIAYNIFENVIRYCDSLVDIHTGSFHRSNLHQLRADLRRAGVLELARGLGSEIVVHNSGRRGTLRGAAVEAGIPAVTIEAGEPARLSVVEVREGVASIVRLMAYLGMTASDGGRRPTRQDLYYRSHWVRAPAGGILVSKVALGQSVVSGQELGTITDPMSSRQHTLRSRHSGRVIGMAFDQLVMPGFATTHVAIAGAAAQPGAPEEDPLEDDLAVDEILDLDVRPE